MPRDLAPTAFLRFLSTLLLAAVYVDALIISTSQVTSCLLTDANTNNELSDCARKLTMQLALTDDTSSKFLVSTFLDGEGNKKNLGSELLIQVSKTPVTVQYPIKYINSVNNQPYELSFTVDTFLGGLFGDDSGCKDSPAHDKPSCGWLIDNEGGRIPDSQGFCCRCDSDQQFGVEKGSSHIRGGLNCALLGSGQASAHCLRYDDLWYDVWEVGTSQLVYSITVAVFRAPYSRGLVFPNGTVYDEDTAVPESQACADRGIKPVIPYFVCQSAAEIGPTRKTAVLNGVAARQVGDYALPAALRDLTAKYLLSPARDLLSDPEANPQTAGGVNASRYMLVDKTLVDLDDTICDRMGTGPSAFRAHGYSGGCSVSVGTCLQHNQPKELFFEDVEAENKGEQPSYFAAGFGKVKIFKEAQYEYRVGFELQQDHVSSVLVEVEADDVRALIPVAPGQIFLATVNTFEALSGDGRLKVGIINTGLYRTAIFYLRFECPDEIFPILAQTVELGPYEDHIFELPIRVVNDASAEYTCEVHLDDAISQPLDSIALTVKTNATCFCLGQCDCNCDAAGTTYEHCISEYNPETGAEEKSGGGISLNRLWHLMGISAQLGLGLLVGLSLLVGFACCAKAGLLSLVVAVVRIVCASRRSRQPKPPPAGGTGAGAAAGTSGPSGPAQPRSTDTDERNGSGAQGQRQTTSAAERIARGLMFFGQMLLFPVAVLMVLVRRADRRPPPALQSPTPPADPECEKLESGGECADAAARPSHARSSLVVQPLPQATLPERQNHTERRATAWEAPNSYQTQRAHGPSLNGEANRQAAPLQEGSTRPKYQQRHGVSLMEEDAAPCWTPPRIESQSSIGPGQYLLTANTGATFEADNGQEQDPRPGIRGSPRMAPLLLAGSRRTFNFVAPGGLQQMPVVDENESAGDCGRIDELSL